MSVRQLIPEDLAEVAPDPELARILAGIELSRLSGYPCVEVLKARYRQLNHERARLMATMVEVGLCDIGPDDELPRGAAPDEFSADEIRAALVLTRRAADAQPVPLVPSPAARSAGHRGAAGARHRAVRLATESTTSACLVDVVTDLTRQLDHDVSGASRVLRRRRIHHR